MARRSDSTASSTIVAPADRDLSGRPGAQSRPAPGAGAGARHADTGKTGWWRLRTWRRDVEVLARVRAGLENLPDDDSDVDTAAANGLAARARTSGKGTASEHATTAGKVAAGTAAAGDSPSAEHDAAAASGDGSDHGIAAVRRTFASVAAAGDAAVGYFYAQLFVRDPKLRELFPPAMDEQRDRLFHALARIIETLTSPEDLAAYLAQLGRDHRKYSVEPAMYETVGAALIATLRRFAGEDFTPAAREAWEETYAAASALMIRSAEEDGAATPAHWSAEVVDIARHSDGIAVLTIAPDQPLRYEPGQHVTVQTPRWPHVWRPYSIACRPREDGLLRLHVKAISGGWVSNALVHHTEPGDELILGPAMGTMKLGSAGNRNVLLVAGGTGLSPLKAIAEQAVKDSARHPGRQIFLFYGARCRAELYDVRDLWRLSDACAGFQLTPVTSDDPAFDGMQGNVGRVAARYMPDKDCEAYVAGPVSMVRETLRVLTRAGIARDRIHYDDALLAAGKRVGTGT
jgi:NAD(P)H-flavin reductase/hemoglobin-like flavoprotein